VLAVACGSEEVEAPVVRSETGPLVVYAVNRPLAEFAERIGGEAVRVVLPVPANVDPADWTPGAEEVAAFQTADLVLDQGGGYAAWLDHVTLRRERVVDTTAALRDRMLPAEAVVTHQHGPQGAHAHGTLATETWLDPSLAAAQAEAVAAAFSRARPEHAEAFERGLAALEGELRELDEQLAAAARRLDGRPILFSHPVYTYLVQRYALNARSLHWEPDEAPTRAQWRDLDAVRSEHPARLLVWEHEPLPESARRLAALGIRSVVFETGARAGASTLARLRVGAEVLAAAAASDAESG
jgi:zinc transport system substrate-binding protein